jgi:hypothetical protein
LRVLVARSTITVVPASSELTTDVRNTPTNFYPRNAIGWLLTDNNVTGCTGVLYGSSTLVTAAHCLYDDEKGAWRVDDSSPWTFYPGIDGDILGTPLFCNMTSAFILAEFTTNNAPETDMGAVALDCSIPASR